MDEHQITQSSAEVGGAHVEWLEAGSGPLAICLHGFPDSAHSWRHLLPQLAQAGFRAVAPWTRGYAPSGLAPDGLYQAGVRGRDACLLHEALDGDGDAVIIGHDFGAGAANIAATMEPERWCKAVMMAVPPRGRMTAAFFEYDQIRRSSYMFFFQHSLSEMVLPHNDWEFIRRLWSDWSPGLDSDVDVSHFIDAVTPPDHLDAVLSYYRASFQGDRRSPEFAPWDDAGKDGPPQPTLYLHGRNDGCIGVALTEGLEDELSPGSKVVVFDNIGHFMQLEDPDLVNNTILKFLSE